MDIENQSTNNQIKKSTLQVLSVKSEKLQNEIILATPNSNGFTNGLTILQILPVTYGLMLITQTIILIMNLKNTILIVVTSIIFSIVTVLLVILWFLATKIDPTDQTQLQHRRAIQNRIQFNFANCKYFCQVCHTYVGKESFHCKKCNRCVQMFDHHCKWLNNCIGAKNYLQFFGLICCTQIQLILNLVFNCVNIGLTIFNKEQLTWKFYLQITFIFCDGIILFFNSALFFIHLYLVITKKTTLQLILQKRKANQIHPSKQQKDLQKRNSQQINENISSNLSSSLEEKQLKKLKTSSEMKYNKFQLKNMNTNKSRCKTLVIKTNKLEL